MRILFFCFLGIMFSCNYSPASSPQELAGARQPATSPDQHADEAKAVLALRARITEFLSVWLVKKDAASALEFFSPRAFRNPTLLSEDCAGYLTPSDRRSRSGARRGVKRFLRQWSSDVRGKELSAMLSIERLEKREEDWGWRAVNDLASDHFLLFQVATERELTRQPLWVHQKATQQMLLRELPAGPLYVSVAVLGTSHGEVSFYAVWKRQQATWFIVHLDILCQ